MTRPPTFVVILLLLSAVWFVSSQPLIQVTVLLIAVFIILGLCARALLRRGMQQVVRGIAGLLAVAAITAVALVQPHLQETYVPNDPTRVPGIVDHSGFYATETDDSGTRYAWTQHSAVLTLDSSVHKPITLTVAMRSAALAGGPDLPVNVRVNDMNVGQFRPDPKNRAFQSLSLRFVPPDGGGNRATIVLLPTTFTLNTADTRILGTMIKSITIDQTEAWSGVARRMWLLWALPGIAALATMLAVFARRTRAALPGYATIAVCLAGATCALALMALRLRVGVIETLPYRVGVVSSAYLACCCVLVAALLPLGRPDARNAWAWGRVALTRIATARNSSNRAAASISRSRTQVAIAQDLAAVFIVALAVRIVWMLFVPPWLAPDESEHYLYISHIVEQGEIPHPPFPDLPAYPDEFNRSVELTRISSIAGSYGGMVERTSPYYPINRDYHEAQTYQTSRPQRLSSAGGRATGYPPLFYILDAAPYTFVQGAPIITRLFAARGGAALLGAASCIFGYLLAYEIRRERRWGWALGMCMALMPMYAFTNATVNNDVAMNLFATALIWFLARAWLRAGLSRLLALAIGSTSMLVLVTKPTAVSVVGFAALIVVAKTIMMLRAQTRWPVLTAVQASSSATKDVAISALHCKGQDIAAICRRVVEVLAAPGIYLVTICAGYSPYLAFRLHFFKDVGIGVITAATTFVHFLSGIIFVSAATSSTPDLPSVETGHSYTLVAYLLAQRARGEEHFYWLLVRSFWGVFGWLDSSMPDQAYIAITVFIVIGLIGLGIQLVLQPKWRSALLLCIGLVATQVFFLFIVVDYFWSFRRNGGEYGLQGRYFFPILAPFLFILLSGWDHLLQERPIALRLAPFCMLAVQLVALATIIGTYYGVEIG